MVLSKQEVNAIFNAINNLKHQTIFMLAYSAQDIIQNLSTRTVQKEFQKAVINAGIKKSSVVVHTLRHSFATHLLEAGTK